MRVLENVPLRELTTLAVGGPARYLIEARVEDDVPRAAGFGAEKGLPVFVLGGGSNVLVADEGFDGVVVRIALAGCEIPAGPGAPCVVRAAAGEDWDALVARCVERGLGGIECLSGIPGTVGATPIQNVGAYGQEVAGTIVSVRAFDRLSGAVRRLTPAECAFGYRTSVFNTTERDRYIVLDVSFALTPGAAPTLLYGELSARFEGVRPSLGAVREAVRDIRRGKGMLLVAGDPDCRSAGSFFKNPVLSEVTYRALIEAAGTGMPSYEAGEGKVKVSAAWLVENAGYKKGMALGGAGLSTRHSLALINRGHAAARDLFDLARGIRRTVRARFGVLLEPEPVLLGFEQSLDS